VSSDGGSPTARDSGDGAVTPVSQVKTQRASGTGSLTKRLSGRFSQEAFAAKEQELSFLQQRCVQFEVRFASHQGTSAVARLCSCVDGACRGVMRAGSMPPHLHLCSL
jgi:hypothetical protein